MTKSDHSALPVRAQTPKPVLAWSLLLGLLGGLLLAPPPAASAAPDLPKTDFLYHSARFDLMDGKAEAALAKLEQAQRLAPADSRLLMLRVRVLADLGRQAEALELTGRLLAETPGAAGELRLARADLLAGLGRRQEALDELRAAEADHPREALRRRADILMRAKRFGEAAEALAELEPADSGGRQEVLFLRGRALYLDHDYPAAAAVLERAHTLDPASATARAIRRWREEALRAQRPWWAGASLSWMYDSNVFLDPVFEDPAHAVASGRSDQAWVAEARAGLRLRRWGRTELGIGLSGQNVEYLELTEAATTHLAPGFYLAGGDASFGWRVPYRFYYYFKGSSHQAYSRIHSLSPHLYWQTFPHLRTYVSGTLLERSYFDGRSGAVHYGGALDLVWQPGDPDDFIRLGARADHEDAYDGESGYRGYEATLAAGAGLSGAFGLSAELTWAQYDFDRREEWTLDFRAFDRRDRQWRLSAQAFWRLPERWRLSLAYYYLANDSNVEPPALSPYDYHKTVVTLTIGKSF